MSLYNLNDVIRVAARANISDVGDFVNVYHYQVTGVSSSTDAQIQTGLLARIDGLYTILNGFFPSYLHYIDINLFNVTQNKPIGSFAWPTLVAGSGGAGDNLPPMTAAFVRGLSGYSRNWAKKFLYPMVEGTSENHGTLTGGLMTALGTFGVGWLDTVLPVGGAVLASVVHRSATGSWVPITEFVARNVWASMRRRRPGRGS